MSIGSRYLEVGDLLASRLNAMFSATAPAAAAERVYAVVVKDADLTAWLASARTMRIFVVPDLPKRDYLTRNEDDCSYPFDLIFVEKCSERGIPGNDWIDPRVALVDVASKQLGDLRKALDGDLDGLRCTANEYTTYVDEFYLVEHGAFYSEIALTFEERRNA